MKKWMDFDGFLQEVAESSLRVLSKWWHRRLHIEKEFQDLLDTALGQYKISVRPEYPIKGLGRIDLVIKGNMNIGIETKLSYDSHNDLYTLLGQCLIYRDFVDYMIGLAVVGFRHDKRFLKYFVRKFTEYDISLIMIYEYEPRKFELFYPKFPKQPMEKIPSIRLAKQLGVKLTKINKVFKRMIMKSRIYSDIEKFRAVVPKSEIPIYLIPKSYAQRIAKYLKDYIAFHQRKSVG